MLLSTYWSSFFCLDEVDSELVPEITYCGPPHNSEPGCLERTYMLALSFGSLSL